MKLIAHRGNWKGKSKDENNPDYILAALDKGFDAEIDVWFLDGIICLGHDEPQFEVDLGFIKNPKMWCHAKNEAALLMMLKKGDIHCFWHENDHFALTSKGIPWVFPNKKLIEGSVCVLPELGHDGDITKCFGICSDFLVNYQ